MSIYVRVHEASFILQAHAVDNMSTKPLLQHKEGAKDMRRAIATKDVYHD